MTSLRTAPHVARPRDSSLDLLPFDGILTGYKRVGFRFQMSWVETWPEASNGLMVLKPGGRISTIEEDDFADGAWNMNENGDDGLGIEAGGVNVDGTAYPVGFFKQPIRGDDGFNNADPGSQGAWAVDRGPAAVIWPRVANDGKTIIYYFERMNQHDGACDEPLFPINDRMARHLLEIVGREPAFRQLMNRTFR